jgi:aerobic-type carbon monoxide dehydrogenase small subunit (CoxS/CutS family)
MATVTELHVNGSRQRVHADAGRSLLFVLRHDLDLTGTKYGCGEGRCGACTVLIDGKPVKSCITDVGSAEGKPIRTIESVEQNGQLHPLQQAFLDADALQCAFCTSGMIMAALPVVGGNANPSDEDILGAMNGNICRCGTYPRIMTAIRKACQARKGGGR